MSLVGADEARVIATREPSLSDAFMPEPPKRRSIVYEVPLRLERSGHVYRGRLVLPSDLTKDEAERLCGVIRALAMPGEGTGMDAVLTPGVQ